MRRAGTRSGLVLLLLICLAASGCNREYGYKQLRLEGESIASSAQEGAVLARQHAANRIPTSFTEVQADTIAQQFGSAVTAIAVEPAQPSARQLAHDLSDVGLEGQRTAAELATAAGDRGRARALQRQLSDIADEADVLTEQARAKELGN